MTNLTSQIFHPGETQIQTAVGRRERVEEMGRVLMRDHLIEQHREFYAGLEYVFLSTVDATGKLKAVMVSGVAGFLTTPDDKTLRLDAKLSDALVQLGDLALGSMIGVVGIDLSNRRRNRMHGRVEGIHASHVDIRVTQSYGNCPKYINVRELTTHFEKTDLPVVENSRALNDADREAIRAADIFFIASFFDRGQGDAFEGADMSHRGGNPGFIHVEGDKLIIPDYFGNNLFNTFGNLSMNPVTALLFLDFETGATRHLTGTTAIIDEPARIALFPKALRLLEVTVQEVIVTHNATPLRWAMGEVSPHSPGPFSKLEH